jgi:hypothetical protein
MTLNNLNNHKVNVWLMMDPSIESKYKSKNQENLSKNLGKIKLLLHDQLVLYSFY